MNLGELVANTSVWLAFALVGVVAVPRVARRKMSGGNSLTLSFSRFALVLTVAYWFSAVYLSSLTFAGPLEPLKELYVDRRLRLVELLGGFWALPAVGTLIFGRQAAESAVRAVERARSHLNRRFRRSKWMGSVLKRLPPVRRPVRENTGKKVVVVSWTIAMVVLGSFSYVTNYPRINYAYPYEDELNDAVLHAINYLKANPPDPSSRVFVEPQERMNPYFVLMLPNQPEVLTFNDGNLENYQEFVGDLTDDDFVLMRKSSWNYQKAQVNWNQFEPGTRPEVWYYKDYSTGNATCVVEEGDEGNVLAMHPSTDSSAAVQITTANRDSQQLNFSFKLNRTDTFFMFYTYVHDYERGRYAHLTRLKVIGGEVYASDGLDTVPLGLTVAPGTWVQVTVYLECTTERNFGLEQYHWKAVVDGVETPVLHFEDRAENYDYLFFQASSSSPVNRTAYVGPLSGSDPASISEEKFRADFEVLYENSLYAFAKLKSSQ
ncbi:MAG: hypothetical protein Kow0069_09040 [Promethearchaeota archaeon]